MASFSKQLLWVYAATSAGCLRLRYFNCNKKGDCCCEGGWLNVAMGMQNGGKQPVAFAVDSLSLSFFLFLCQNQTETLGWIFYHWATGQTPE